MDAKTYQKMHTNELRDAERELMTEALNMILTLASGKQLQVDWKARASEIERLLGLIDIELGFREASE